MSEYTSSTAIMTGQVPGGSGGSGGSGGTPLGTVLDDVYTWLGRFIATIDEADRSLRLSPWPPPRWMVRWCSRSRRLRGEPVVHRLT